nr:MAG TPA: hypothetical protein [Caudoviricetes sp.]
MTVTHSQFKTECVTILSWARWPCRAMRYPINNQHFRNLPLT